jgi:hypothetical protein
MERYMLTASSDGVLEIDVELAPWAVMSIVQASGTGLRRRADDRATRESDLSILVPPPS